MSCQQQFFDDVMKSAKNDRKLLSRKIQTNFDLEKFFEFFFTRQRRIQIYFGAQKNAPKKL